MRNPSDRRLDESPVLVVDREVPQSLDILNARQGVDDLAAHAPDAVLPNLSDVEAATAAIAYGVVIVLAAWLAGPTRVATAARRAAAPFLREPRYAWGAAAAIVLLLIIWGPTPATRSPIPLLALIALLALGVELLRRQTAREFPDATIEGAGERMRAWAAGLRGPR